MIFSELGLSPKVLAAIEAAGYKTPTPIQEKAIPVAVRGQDVLGIAQTGTGKTASFVLPMLSRLERGRARARMPRSLILAPTRELAAQVAENFERYGAQHKITLALLIGGVSFDDQNRKLDRGVDVLIATPGRLLDHYGRGKLLLTAVEILVIDEADRMLDMGFIPDIERICSLLPVKRQTLFFSATMPQEIQRLVDRFLTNPERIAVAPQSTTAATIIQRFRFVSHDPKQKREALRDWLRSEEVKNAIIFCNRKKDVEILFNSLKKHGLNAGALHGDMDQSSRTATLEAFRAGTISLLAASDVAARGLDIPDVSHVFNYDTPLHAEDYVHRIGRTGRAGREGCSATLVTDDDMKTLREIEAMLKVPLDWVGGKPPEDAGTREGRRKRGSAISGSSRERSRPERDRGGRSRRGADAGDRPRSAAEDTVERPAEKAARPPRRPEPQPRADKTAPAPQERPHARPRSAPQSERNPHRSNAEARPGGRGPQRGKPNRQNGATANAGPVVGMGDHMPAFMRRPPGADPEK